LALLAAGPAALLSAKKMPPAEARQLKGRLNPFLALATVATVFLAALPWMTSFGPVSGEPGGLIAAAAVTAMPGFLLLKASLNRGLSYRLQQALLLLALAILLTAGGNLIRFLGALGVPLPSIPGVGVVTTLGIWALGLAALIRLPLMPVVPGTAWRIATDIIIAGLGMALAIYVIWTLPGLRQAPQAVRREITLFNLMEAGNLVVLNLILVRGPLRPVRRAVWWLCATAVIETVYLVAFQYSLGRQSPGDRLANSLFFVDYLAYLYAADAFLRDTQPGIEEPLRPVRLWSINPLPIVAVLGVGGLLIASSVQGLQAATIPLAIGTVLMTLLLLGRVIASTVGSLQDAQRRVDEDRHRQNERLDLVGRLSGRIANIVQALAAGVRGHAELIRSDAGLSTRVGANIEAIADATQRASLLAERLLLASGRKRGDQRPRRLSEIVRLQQDAMNRYVGDKRIMIWDLAPGSGRALAAPSDIETIVRELVSNAGEATLHGGKITVSIREVTLDHPSLGISPCPPPGDYSVLEISDTGQGITQDDLPHVIEPFFTRKTAGLNRGLGLSVVHGIVARCGGGLEIDTTPGSGSQVRVYLPVEQVHSG
jgi:signal transduction histidine kinase